MFVNTAHIMIPTEHRDRSPRIKYRELGFCYKHVKKKNQKVKLLLCLHINVDTKKIGITL